MGDLLGDYSHNQQHNAKQKELINKQESKPNNNGNSIPSDDTIQAIFDDIFEEHEETENAPTILSIFTDDEGDDLESTQEGFDADSTTFTMPPGPTSHANANEDDL